MAPPEGKTKGWGLKLLAGGIALALWFFVVTTQRSQVALAARVEYVGLHDDVMLVGERVDSLDVEVKGVRSVVARLGPDTIRVKVNVADLRDGESVLQISPEQVEVPAGVAVVRISPAHLRVAVARVVRATVRVTPRIHGAPAVGHVVRRVTVEPPAVQIKAPRSTIDARGTIETMPLDVSGLRQTVTRRVGLAVPQAATVDEAAVRVTIEIGREEEMRQRKQRAGR
jgi:hypothetical protein